MAYKWYLYLKLPHRNTTCTSLLPQHVPHALHISFLLGILIFFGEECSVKLATVGCAEDTEYLVWTGILAKSPYVQHRQVSKAA